MGVWVDPCRVIWIGKGHSGVSKPGKTELPAQRRWTEGSPSLRDPAGPKLPEAQGKSLMSLKRVSLSPPQRSASDSKVPFPQHRSDRNVSFMRNVCDF